MVKKYKSANGKIVDMDGIRLKNEEIIAVGNMRTNARGDELGPDDVVHDSTESIRRSAETSKIVADIVNTVTEESKLTDNSKEEKPKTEELPEDPAVRKTSRGGLAAALAAAQTTTTTNPVQPKETKKVRRIG